MSDNSFRDSIILATFGVVLSACFKPEFFKAMMAFFTEAKKEVKPMVVDEEPAFKVPDIMRTAQFSGKAVTPPAPRNSRPNVPAIKQNDYGFQP